MNLIGQVVKGYKIIDFINDGGFGVVYKAEKDGVLYAIKIFKEAYVLREYRKGDDNRIQREIDVIRSVKHKNLVCYEENFTQDIDGSPHHLMVMEYVDGTNLRDKLNSETKLSEAEALTIFAKLLDGVEALHSTTVVDGSTGVIHRDLKPENILIDHEGNIKITDYGLAKIIDYTSITSTGEIFGTGPYMSPEQITDSKHIDRRSDLYALGVILYEMLTGVFPYDFQSEPELIDKIKNEPPTPPRRRVFEISNSTENIILRLLEKHAYERFTDVQQIRESLEEEEIVLNPRGYDLNPRFVLRLWDDKATLTNYIDQLELPLMVEFPANLKKTQSGLLKLVTESTRTIVMVDPATMRLAYETYADNEGLKNLPYAREDFQPITVDYLKDYKQQKEYVKSVIDEEVAIGADVLLAPFHYTHNSNVSLTTTNPHAEWFDLDIKLLKEAIDYKNSKDETREKEIYAGICIHQTAINDERERRHILNTYSLFNCDGYLFYVDCIDDKTSKATLLNYIKLLRELQENTGKPVVAGRLGTIGLGLLCAGVAGYSSGTARFERFSEDLYKEAGPAYNLYDRYYYPELLSTIPILKKDPARFETINGVLGSCACKYCAGKDTSQTLQTSNTKLHFMEKMMEEVKVIYEMSEDQRIDYFISRIDTAIDNYTALTPSVFKPSDYAHLHSWREVFLQLK